MSSLFIIALAASQDNRDVNSREMTGNAPPEVRPCADLFLPPSLADVIHLVRRCSDGAPSFIYAQTRLVSELGFAGEDGQELLHEAECHFRVSFPRDAVALRALFSLEEHEYLFSADGIVPFSLGWLLCRLRGKPLPVPADITVGDFHQVLIKLCMTGWQR